MLKYLRELRDAARFYMFLHHMALAIDKHKKPKDKYELAIREITLGVNRLVVLYGSWEQTPEWETNLLTAKVAGILEHYGEVTK